MSETKIEITRLDETDNAALYCQYSGQNEPQDCYLELDLDAGTLRADYNGEIGNAVPFNVWHGRTIRFGIPAGTLPGEANRLMDEIVENAQTMLDHYTSEWDGNNHIGRLDSAAWEGRSEIEIQRGDPPAETPGQDARDAIEEYLDGEIAINAINCLRVEDCAEWYSHTPQDRERHKGLLRSGTSSEDLETLIEGEVNDCSDEPTVLDCVSYYIEQLREEIEDIEPGECDGCKHLRTEAPHGPRCGLVDSLTLLDADSKKCGEYSDIDQGETTEHATGWVACDYTDGDMLADVPHHEIRDTHEEAAADAKRLCLDGVRWVGTDGYLYVDQQD